MTPVRRAPRAVLVLLLVPALVAAGCVSAPAGDEPGTDTVAPPAFIDPIHDDHDHADLSLHQLSTPTMEKVGYSAFDGGGMRFTSFGEMDLHEDLAVISAVRIGETRQGVIIMVDLSDPTDPKRLGVGLVGDASHPLDVKFDASGAYVFATATGQIHAFDVSDPSNPLPAGAMLPPGVACHMSALGVVAGVEYFFCTGDPTGLTVYRVVDVSPGRALVPVGRSSPDGGPQVGGSLFGGLGAPHDMTFQEDPVTGDPILVVSNRGFGVRVLDIRDPANPVQLARWHGEGADHFSNHMHTAMVTLVNGTRYVIVSPEILDSGNPPAVWMLDATDYANLILAAEWTAPNDHPSPGFTFTTHQWQVAEERLYLGYYHAGVWVLDLPTILDPGFRDDPARGDVLGYYLPHEDPVEPAAMVPNVWDVTLRNGLIFATDISSGLYVLHHLPDAIGDEAITGFS